MKCKKIVIKNFRSLRDITIDFEDELSLVIGKNNCGKTSFLLVLEKFFYKGNKEKFHIEDFNIEFQKKLKHWLDLSDDNELEESFNDGPKGIEMYLYIEYSDEDSLANISSLMLDLNPDNHTVGIKFQYAISFNDLIMLKKAYTEFSENTNVDDNDKFKKFMKRNISKFFKVRKYAVLPEEIKKKYETDNKPYEDNRELDKNFDLSTIINFAYIPANRESTNKENSALSNLSNEYSTLIGNNEDIMKNLQGAIVKADEQFDEVYAEMFENVIKDIRMFGGYAKDEMKVIIQSEIDEEKLVNNNTALVYDNDQVRLPENYNGLGYINLINIIIKLEIILTNFKNREGNTEPSNINLLFIEEPEAHTHPQMQYIFIKNIKDMLKTNSESDPKINLQTIISTHSSHIVSQCDFDDIKYFHKVDASSVKSLNLKNLENVYGKNPRYWKFLKQYLTLDRSELFFADKVILYEGDTERILLPAMMKKIDESDSENKSTPLLSQNISMIPAGANSKIFDGLLGFLGIKALIITDIDSVKKQEGSKSKVKCAVDDKDCNDTSNASIKHFFSEKLDEERSDSNSSNIEILKKLKKKDKIFAYKNDNWEHSEEGKLMIAYQTEETNGKKSYYPRSFEDAFIFVNIDFLNKYIDSFENVTYKEEFHEAATNSQGGTDWYNLGEHCKDAKASFAMNVLVNSYSNDDQDWKIPPYIKEGLEWLKKD